MAQRPRGHSATPCGFPENSNVAEPPAASLSALPRGGGVSSPASIWPRPGPPSWCASLPHGRPARRKPLPLPPRRAHFSTKTFPLSRPSRKDQMFPYYASSFLSCCQAETAACSGEAEAWRPRALNQEAEHLWRQETSLPPRPRPHCHPPSPFPRGWSPNSRPAIPGLPGQNHSGCVLIESKGTSPGATRQLQHIPARGAGDTGEVSKARPSDMNFAKTTRGYLPSACYVPGTVLTRSTFSLHEAILLLSPFHRGEH